MNDVRDSPVGSVGERWSKLAKQITHCKQGHKITGRKGISNTRYCKVCDKLRKREKRKNARRISMS